MLWLKAFLDGSVNSLIFRNPKNPKEKAADNICLSQLLRDLDFLTWNSILLRIGAEMGCRFLFVARACVRLAPWSTSLNLAMKGSNCGEIHLYGGWLHTPG